MSEQTIPQQVERALRAPLGRLARLDPVTVILASGGVNQALLAAQAELAAMRRSAVRQLRLDGYTLTDIASMVGLAPQRIHQIEVGFDNKERRRRRAENTAQP